MTPYESLSLRTSSVSALCIHPKLPIMLGISSKKTTISSIPRGPGSFNLINNNTKTNTTKTNTTTNTNTNTNTDTNTNSNTSNTDSNQIIKSKILLTLFTYYTKHVIPNPLIIEVESPDNNADINLSPYCMKYSRCGKYLALHTRSYFTSINNIEKTNYQIFIFNVEQNYSFLTYFKLSNGIEDFDWNLKSDILLGAGTDGHLYIFNFNYINNELNLIKSLNLSSSSLSSIVYNEPNDDTDNITKLGILIGTRDGNALFINPKTMSCTNSLLNKIDYPILKISLGFKGIGIVSYISYTNESARIIRIPGEIIYQKEEEEEEDNDDNENEDDYINEFDENENSKEEIGKIEDIMPSFDQNSYSTGCGALITKYGIVAYVKKDGKLIFKNIMDYINSSKNNSKLSSKIIPSKPVNSNISLNNKINNNKNKNNNKNSSNNNGNDSRKRSVDLFDRSNDKDDNKRYRLNNTNNNNNSTTTNNNNNNYYDRNDIEIRRDRYKMIARNKNKY